MAKLGSRVTSVFALLALLLLIEIRPTLGSLQDVFRSTLVNIDEKIEHQLRLVVEVSRQEAPTSNRALKSVDIAGLAKHICAAHNTSSFTELVGAAGTYLQAFREATTQPALAAAVRRTLLACIILQWITHKHQVLGDEAENHLAIITRWFYDRHVRSMAQRGVMEYLHISKCGGSSFCTAAEHSKCSMGPHMGQLEALGDLPRWINGTAFEELTGGTHIMWSYYAAGRQITGGIARGCRRRVALLRDEGYNYVSNEYTLHGGYTDMHSTRICPQMVNVVSLRDPDRRLVSHLHFILSRMKKRLLSPASLRLGAGGADGATDGDYAGSSASPVDLRNLYKDVFCAGNLKAWEHAAAIVIDNYMTRSFVGERAFHTPLGGIGREHVEVARRLLLQFDLVLDLDAGEQAADLLIYQGLGWEVKLSEIHARSSSDVYSKLNYSSSECGLEALLRELLPRQAPDRQLYGFGRTLALLDRLHLALARQLGLRPSLDDVNNGISSSRSRKDSCGVINAGTNTTRRATRRRLL